MKTLILSYKNPAGMILYLLPSAIDAFYPFPEIVVTPLTLIGILLCVFSLNDMSKKRKTKPQEYLLLLI